MPLNQLHRRWTSSPASGRDAFDADIAAGAVIGTDPAADTEVAPGTTVDYVVSLGIEPTPTPEPTPAPVAVPDLRGCHAVRMPSTQLLDAGLQPGERTDKFNSQVPEGQVIRTDPEAGTEVQPGTVVDLRRVAWSQRRRPPPSRRPRRWSCPTSVACPPRMPSTSCSTSASSPVSARTRFDPDIAEGAVIRHRPEAGAGGRAGNQPSPIVVSLAPNRLPNRPRSWSRCPTSVASIAEDAVNALIEVGLQPGEREDRFNDNVPEGQVIRTDPEAGTEVEPGTTVDYRVSRGPEPTPEPTAGAHARTAVRAGHDPRPSRLRSQ